MAQKKSAPATSTKKAAAPRAGRTNAQAPREESAVPPPALPKARKAAKAAPRKAAAPKAAAKPQADKHDKPAPAKPQPRKATGSKTPPAKPAPPTSAAPSSKPAAARQADDAAASIDALTATPPAPGTVGEARPAASFKPKDPQNPTAEELRQVPTEDIWVHYRKAAHLRPRDDKRLEELRNLLMELHYPLVKHIAERLLQTLPKSIELDDLVSAGLFGLMDAIRGFDPDRGIKFKTYCTTRIRGSILDQLRSQDWVPRLVRLKAGRIEKALHKLQGEYGREPTHAELASALQMEHAELSTEMSQSHAKAMFSLSERWDDRDDDNPMEKVEIVEDHKAVDPVHELNRRDVMLYITKSLTHKERFIIEQYYDVGHTMREIGEMLALTESRVCQIHSNVMSRLKGLLSPKSNSLEA